MTTRIALAAALAAFTTLESTAAAQEAPKAPAPAAEAKPAAEAPAPAPAAPAPKFELKDPIAVVDGEEIKIAEVEKAMGDILARQGATVQQVPAEMKPDLYRRVLDGVIVEKLVTKESSKLTVADDAVAKEYDRFKGQFPDENAMKAELSKVGQSPETIRAQIVQFLQRNQWLESKVGTKGDVTDAEAQDFYTKNAEQFKMPEQVRASHILVKCGQDAKDDEVKTKRETANKILDRVKKGEDFATLAGDLSEDPSAKENKGDLDFFPRQGAMVEPFAEAAFKMKKGEVTESPVRSEFGFHIIKVTDRKDAGSMAFDEAKPRLLAYLKQQKKQTETEKVLQELRAQAKVTVNLPQ